MNNCVSRFLLVIFLFYIGFILLGSLVGLAIGLLISSVILSVILGFFIGVAIGIISHAIVLIIINKTCFKSEHYPC